MRSRLGPDIERVLAVARDLEVQGFVVGIPFSLDGGMGPGARRARGFARSLREHTDLPIYTVDERFTSVEAEGLLREAGRQPSREKGSVDAAAAALILERFLDLQRE